MPSYRHFFDRYARYKETPVFKTLEISVSNRCNFKCVTCNERFSNQFGPTIDNEIPDEEYFKEEEETVKELKVNIPNAEVDRIIKKYKRIKKKQKSNLYQAKLLDQHGKPL